MSKLQNVEITKCRNYKMSKLQDVKTTKSLGRALQLGCGLLHVE